MQRIYGGGVSLRTITFGEIQGEALGAGSLFSFCGDLCLAIHDICPAYGGAMAEEKEADEGKARGKFGSRGNAGQRLDPKNGPAGAAVLLQETAEETLEDYLLEIAACVLDNIRAKHLPTVKLLFDLAARLRARDNVPREEYESLAEVLWKDVQRITVEESAVERPEGQGIRE